jgi:hypothetical protein
MRKKSTEKTCGTTLNLLIASAIKKSSIEIVILKVLCVI